MPRLSLQKIYFRVKTYLPLLALLDILHRIMQFKACFYLIGRMIRKQAKSAAISRFIAFNSRLLRRSSMSLLAMTMLGLLMLPFAVKADQVTELESQISEWQKKWQILEDQRQEYLKSVKEKRSTAANLENQIALIDGEIKFTETNIKQTEAKLAQVSLKIEKSDKEIMAKQGDIGRQKEILSVLFRELYKNGGENIIKVLVENNNLSEAIDNASNLIQVQGKISATLADLKNSKERMEWQRQEQISKKEEYAILKVNLAQENQELAAGRESKKNLLTKTRGEQSRYEDLLKRVEEQRNEILGNIADLQKQKAEELAKIQSKQLLPAPNPVATLWHYYQTDPRWGDSFIGFSKSTMREYGCAIASLAMVFKYYNVDITPGQLARQPIFYYDLIKWPDTWRGIDLMINSGHIQSINWQNVDAHIKNGYPVIVFVRAVGKKGGHYVVIFAKDARGYIVNDPMWGSNIYLDSTRQNIGTLYDTTTAVEQMIVYK